MTDKSTTSITQANVDAILSILPFDMVLKFTKDNQAVNPLFYKIDTWEQFIKTIQTFRHLDTMTGRVIVDQYDDIYFKLNIHNSDDWACLKENQFLVDPDKSTEIARDI